ncbi:diguanylate cyclase [Achromobacter insuavis]
MSTLRRLILCTALLIAFILLGAQALGMLAAHRYLNTQLAQQGQAGASALAWVLSHDPGGVQDKRQLADDLFGAGMYALVRIAGENGDTQAERRESAPNGQAGASRDWRDAWLSMDAPAATRPIWGRMGGGWAVTVQADARLARDTLWQGGVRVIGLTLAAGVFWTLFAANLMRWLEARTSRDGLGRDRARAEDGANARRAREPDGVDAALADAQRQAAATVQQQNARIESLESEIQRDAVTRLPNRKYFIDHFRQALTGQAADTGGHILMFRQRDLAQINRHLSRAFTDQWLRSSADRLRKLVDANGGADMTLARIGGSDFALLMPRTSAPRRACWPSGSGMNCARCACRWTSTAGAAGRWRWRPSRRATTSATRWRGSTTP